MADLEVDSLRNFSDIRLKKNIVVIDNALTKVEQMRGVYYNWIDERRGTERVAGVIAQEVQAVMPELVAESSNGYLSVDYSKLTSVLIESVKEISNKTNKLFEKNELLNKRVC